MFDEPTSEFYGGEEESDLILIPDQANLCVGTATEARNLLIHLKTGKPDDEDLDQDDPNYTILKSAYAELDRAIAALSKTLTKFVEASS